MSIDDMSPREAYETGYRNGESSLEADIGFVLEDELGIEYEGHPITAVREEIVRLRTRIAELEEREEDRRQDHLEKT